MGALVLEGLVPPQRLPHDGDVLPGLGQRLPVGDAVPSLDDLGPRHAEPEEEPAGRQEIDGRRRHGGLAQYREVSRRLGGRPELGHQLAALESGIRQEELWRRFWNRIAEDPPPRA